MKRLTNIELMRCYAVLSLVTWHSLCVYTGWIEILPDIKEAVEDNLITRIYNVLSTVVFIPGANMPLFTAISGFVYSFLYFNHNKYRDFKVFLWNKSKRLLIPYFVIGTIVVLTIFDWEPYKILTGEAHHLWYCIMLFWCFLLIRFYQNTPPRSIKVLIIVFCLFIQVLPLSYDLLGIVQGFKYFPYFIMGYYLSIYYPVLKSKKGIVPMTIILWVLSIGLRLYLGHLTIIVTYTFTFMLFIIIPENVKIGHLISRISEYSFGIYVFHEWFLWNAAHIKGLHPFIIEHQIIYPSIAFVSAFFLSFLLTHFSMKTKIGRFLLA